MIPDNKLYAGFLIKASMALGDVKKSVVDSVAQIKENCENAALLFYQAKGLIQLNMYEHALVMAKYACEMCPESTNAWVLLARCYLLNNDYQRVSARLR